MTKSVLSDKKCLGSGGGHERDDKEKSKSLNYLSIKKLLFRNHILHTHTNKRG